MDIFKRMYKIKNVGFFNTEVLTTVQTGCGVVFFFSNSRFQWYFYMYTLINLLYLRIFFEFHLGNAPTWTVLLNYLPIKRKALCKLHKVLKFVKCKGLSIVSFLTG